MGVKKQNNKTKDWICVVIAIIFYIFIIIGICLTSTNNNSNNTQTSNNQKEIETTYTTQTTYIQSGEYYRYIIDTLKEVNDDDIFTYASSRTRYPYLIYELYSVNRMTHDEFEIQAEALTKRLYEKIKDKTIKKDGILSHGYFTINLEFFEKFNSNMNPKNKKYNSVGIYQIHTDDLEKYRNYDDCVNGGINDLEWEQERK